MLKNYLKIALRHLKKNKGFSFINMIGLSLGMACALLILLWVNDEIGYNRFHKNYKNLYQILENQAFEGKTYTFSATPGQLAAAMKSELPEIKYAATFDWGSRELFTLGDKSIYEEGYYTEPDFLQMLTFPAIKGDTTHALDDVSSLIISESMAKKFFGKENPIGKTLRVNNDKPFTVVAVIGDHPDNSSLRFEWLASFKIYETRSPWLHGWNTNGVQTLVQLQPTANPAAVNKKLYGFIQARDKKATARPFLFSIRDWHLRSNFEEGKQAGGRIEYIRLFSIIALIIIIIACINFMNLATARSEQRAREVGVRKVMGAVKGQLVGQFVGESIMMAVVAILLAAIIVFLALSGFNQLVDKKLSFDFSNPVIWAGLPLLALLCGLLAGSYPSFYLSSFAPTTVFRGLRAGKSSAANYIRKGLVITQFVVSIALIISTVIIYQQLQHIKSRQLGYNKENVLISSVTGKMNEHFAAIRDDLLATGAVENAAVSNSPVLELGSSTGGITWEGKDPTKQVLVTTEWVSPQYVSTMGMQIKHGRDFYSDALQDSSNVIINESFARIIGKEDPVGQILRWKDGKKEIHIVGVVRDFVFNDMYGKPDPVILYCQSNSASNLLVRLKARQDMQTAVNKVEAVIKKDNPGYPFVYRFMEEDFKRLFRSENLIGKLSQWFAGLTIIISCLGLFGLAAYTAERRTKEIGIRKVLGATVNNIVQLLSRDFLKLVLIAAIIAFPLSWLVMNKWLNDFAYRVQINWWVFVAAGSIACLIALLTVSFQAIKAAIANPVKSLRTE